MRPESAKLYPQGIVMLSHKMKEPPKTHISIIEEIQDSLISFYQFKKSKSEK